MVLQPNYQNSRCLLQWIPHTVSSFQDRYTAQSHKQNLNLDNKNLQGIPRILYRFDHCWHHIERLHIYRERKINNLYK